MLVKTTEALLAALEERRAAKESWLAIIDHGESGDPMAARQQHFQADERVESLVPQVVDQLQLARIGGLLEIQLLELEPEGKLEILRGFLADRNLQGLLEDGAPEEYTELVEAWYQTSQTRDAARRLNELRRGCFTLSEFKKLTAEEAPSYRDPEAFFRALATFEAFFERAEAEEEAERLADATHSNSRFWLRRYDALTEHLQERTEDLIAADSLSYELADLDTFTRRALVAAIDGGLIRQLQPEAKPKSAPKEVTTITRATN